MAIEVLRDGQLSETSYRQIAKASVVALWGTVRLAFVTPRGTGNSYYRLVVNPEDFVTLAQAMLHADPEEAIKAFGAALQEGIPERCINDKKWRAPEPSQDAA
jgi:hypothetical protein